MLRTRLKNVNINTYKTVVLSVVYVGLVLKDRKDMAVYVLQTGRWEEWRSGRIGNVV
jgi:hypothetical protein